MAMSQGAFETHKEVKSQTLGYGKTERGPLVCPGILRPFIWPGPTVCSSPRHLKPHTQLSLPLLLLFP